jgi:hypothetical protein
LGEPDFVPFPHALVEFLDRSCHVSHTGDPLTETLEENCEFDLLITEGESIDFFVNDLTLAVQGTAPHRTPGATGMDRYAFDYWQSVINDSFKLSTEFIELFLLCRVHLPLP